MHPDYRNATIEDLWPGDIIRTGPRGSEFLCRFVDARPDDDYGVMMRVSTLDGERQLNVWAETWKERVERV